MIVEFTFGKISEKSRFFWFLWWIWLTLWPHRASLKLTHERNWSRQGESDWVIKQVILRLLFSLSNVVRFVRIRGVGFMEWIHDEYSMVEKHQQTMFQLLEFGMDSEIWRIAADSEHSSYSNCGRDHRGEQIISWVERIPNLSFEEIKVFRGWLCVKQASWSDFRADWVMVFVKSTDRCTCTLCFQFLSVVHSWTDFSWTLTIHISSAISCLKSFCTFVFIIMSLCWNRCRRSCQTWLEFRFKLENYLTLVDERYVALLLNAESQSVAKLPMGTEELVMSIRTLSHTLYALQAALTMGRSLRLVQRVPNRIGFEVWRQMAAENAPKTAGRKIAMLQGVLQPGMSDDPTSFEETWKLCWTSGYQRKSLINKADDVKIRVVAARMPTENARPFAGHFSTVWE